MVCRCGCGNEYGFEPIGHWVCHRCGTMNDSGPLGGKRNGPMAPGQVDSMVAEGVEFAPHADGYVRADSDAWEAWYALGASYASRGNVFEAGLVWTRAARLCDDTGVLAGRCASLTADCVSRVTRAGGKCNTPYARGLELACLRRSPGISYCQTLYGRMLDTLGDMTPSAAFAVRNMASIVMLQSLSLRPDIRDHMDIMGRMVSDAVAGTGRRSMNPFRNTMARRSAGYAEQLVVPYRIAISKVRSAIDGVDDARLSELASIQPDDGTAGFADRLSQAVAKGADLVYLRSRRSSKEEVASEEADMNRLIDEYVGLFMSGDPAPVPANRAYQG